MQDDKRNSARESVMMYLRNVGGTSDFSSIVPLYHQHYSVQLKVGKYRYPRRDRISGFLAHMEQDGMIACTYDQRGNVIEVRLV